MEILTYALLIIMLALFATACYNPSKHSDHTIYKNVRVFYKNTYFENYRFCSLRLTERRLLIINDYEIFAINRKDIDKLRLVEKHSVDFKWIYDIGFDEYFGDGK